MTRLDLLTERSAVQPWTAGYDDQDDRSSRSYDSRDPENFAVHRFLDADEPRAPVTLREAATNGDQAPAARQSVAPISGGARPNDALVIASHRGARPRAR